MQPRGNLKAHVNSKTWASINRFGRHTRAKNSLPTFQVNFVLDVSSSTYSAPPALFPGAGGGRGGVFPRDRIIRNYYAYATCRILDRAQKKEEISNLAALWGSAKCRSFHYRRLVKHSRPRNPISQERTTRMDNVNMQTIGEPMRSSAYSHGSDEMRVLIATRTFYPPKYVARDRILRFIPVEWDFRVI